MADKDSKYIVDKELPQIAQEINKKAKTTKITTLNKAKSMIMKRFFSGSISIDAVTGGGYAFKRIHLLFGARSVGKNGSLNQMVAYNQRICRYCGGILPEYFDVANDRHSIFLRYVLKMRMCQCGGEGRIFIIFDYEKSIEIVEPQTITIKEYIHKENGHSVLEDRYLEAVELYNKLKSKKELDEDIGEYQTLKDLEQYFKSIDIKETEIIQEPTVDYLKNCGILVDKLLVADPEDTEEGIEHARDLIKNKGVDGIIWDSVQAAIPRWVKGRDAADDSMGKEPKQNALLMRHICSSFAAKDLLDESEAYKPGVFLTSQMRSSMAMWEQDSYSGGHGIKHHISLALELKREKFLTEFGTEASFTDQFYGQEVRVRSEKSKLSAPGDMFTFNYYFRAGDEFQVGQIDHVKEIVKLGIFYNIIEQGGAWYKVLGESIQGLEKLVNFCRERPDFVGNMYDQIKEKF
jgi:RecA/RadA recombinase